MACGLLGVEAGAAGQQPSAIHTFHYGAPCPPATKYDKWCLPGEAVVGRVLFVPGGATRVVRAEAPAGRRITRIHLTLRGRDVESHCALFDVTREDPLRPSVCRPYEPRPAGRGRFDEPHLNGSVVTAAFHNQEPYIQEPQVRVYYLK